MSIEHITLRKLLKIMYSREAKQRSILKADISHKQNKEKGIEETGGDFYTPFWSDAKNHVVGELDLRKQTVIRINKNGRRKRLYPLLTKGFLKWYEAQDWPNKKIILGVKAQHYLPELGLIRIENVLALKVKETVKIIYPYFSEEPSLSEEGARLGLWLLKQALPQYKNGGIEILDVFRGVSFSEQGHPLNGNEEESFAKKYKSLITKFEDLNKK